MSTSHHMHRLRNAAAAVMLALAVSGCNSDGSGIVDPPDSSAEFRAANKLPHLMTPNIAGTWTFTVTDDERNCGGGGNTYAVRVTVTQDFFNNITLSADGRTLEGTLYGRQLNASGRYREDGGATEEHLTAAVGPRDRTLSGSSTWTWQGGNYQCDGTSTFTAKK